MFKLITIPNCFIAIVTCCLFFFVIILKIFLKKSCLCKYIDYLYIRIKNNNTKKLEIMITFYSPTSMNNKYQVKSYVEISEAGKNLGGNNVVEYKGTPYFNLPFNYWVSKKELDVIIEKYNALKTYM